MEKEFKELVEEMKEFFNVTSLEKVAIALGFNKSVATTWRGRKTFSKNAILQYNLLKSQAGLEPSYQKTKNRASITYYPHIRASAGHGIVNDNEDGIAIDTNLLNAIKLPQKKLDMIQVQGDSMHPYVENGDFALIEKGIEAKNGDIVIANYLGDLYVKQLQKNPQNRSISLISSNKDYPSFEIKDEDIDTLNIIGILRGVIRVY